MARLTRLMQTRTSTLDSLIAQRELLLRKITSGIAEVEQPQLGRTQYRKMEDMREALAVLDALIAQAGGADPTAVANKRRRPIYPVAQEF